MLTKATEQTQEIRVDMIVSWFQGPKMRKIFFRKHLRVVYQSFPVSSAGMQKPASQCGHGAGIVTQAAADDTKTTTVCSKTYIFDPKVFWEICPISTLQAEASHSDWNFILTALNNFKLWERERLLPITRPDLNSDISKEPVDQKMFDDTYKHCIRYLLVILLLILKCKR